MQSLSNSNISTKSALANPMNNLLSKSIEMANDPNIPLPLLSGNLQSQDKLKNEEENFVMECEKTFITELLYLKE